jgi:hypothetical protein
VALPPIVFVNGRVAASGSGSRWDPFKTVTHAKSLAPAGSIIAIHTDDYQEPQILSGEYVLVTWGGNSLIR